MLHRCRPIHKADPTSLRRPDLWSCRGEIAGDECWALHDEVPRLARRSRDIPSELVAPVEREPPEGLLQLVSVGDRLDVVDAARHIGPKHANGRCPAPVARRVRVAGVGQDAEGPALEAVDVPQVGRIWTDQYRITDTPLTEQAGVEP